MRPHLLTCVTVALWSVAQGNTARMAAAQGPPATVFEAASIKENTSGSAQMVILTPQSGLVSATNVTARMLLRYAYDIPESRIESVPGWGTSVHFDVRAKAPERSPVETLRVMFRAILSDRFRLQAHKESRDTPIDTLVFAQPGMWGPSLRRRQDRCLPDAQPAGGQNAVAPGRCGLQSAFGHISGKDVTISDLAAALARFTGRVVADRTASAQHYDLDLEYTPDAIVLEPSARAEFPGIDPDGPSLTTALRQQLGLKLERTRGPIEVLIIDSVQRPTLD